MPSEAAGGALLPTAGDSVGIGADAGLSNIVVFVIVLSLFVT